MIKLNFQNNNMKKELTIIALFLSSLCLNAQSNWDAQIDTSLRSVLRKHKALVSIPNLPENKENMLKNIDWVTNEFNALNFKVSVLESQTLPVLFAEKSSITTSKPFCFTFI